MSNIKGLRFAATEPDFFSTLNKRVNEYFKTEEIGKHANWEMYLKTVFMYTLYFLPYILALTGVIQNGWFLLLASIVMGLGMAGIGLSVMHDANHGAYSTRPWLNRILGMSINLVGAHAMNWKIQHNVLHHTYTNVEGVDEDIAPKNILRFSPAGEWKKFHRYQHLYAWFFYGLLTLNWVLIKDFRQLIQYEQEGHIRNQRSSAAREWTVMITTKLIYIGYIFVIPVLLLPVAWWEVLIGIVTMHYVAGMILSLIFQPAHVIEGTEFMTPTDNRLVNNWAIHQLHTTTNFAARSRFFSWYVGGLNFQIEHHLFPNICHIHYKKLSRIVRKTTADFGLPYKSERTFLTALWSHARLLKALGRSPVFVMA